MLEHGARHPVRRDAEERHEVGTCPAINAQVDLPREGLDSQMSSGVCKREINRVGRTRRSAVR